MDCFPTIGHLFDITNIVGFLRFAHEYEIEDEYDFLALVCMLCVINSYINSKISLSVIKQY